MFHFRNKAESVPKKKVVAIIWQPYSSAVLQPKFSDSGQIISICHSVLAIVGNDTVSINPCH